MTQTTKRVGIVLKTASGGMWILPQIKALRAHAEVVVVIPDEGGRLSDALDELAREDPGISVWRTLYRFGLMPRPGNVRRYLQFARELRRLQLDAVLYHLYASALAVRGALWGTRVHRVHMVAGPLHLESGMIRVAERILHRADDVIICGSENTRSRYRAIAVPDAKLASVPYGVDTERFAPQDEGARVRNRAELGVPEGDFLAVMVAYVYPPKRMVHAGRGIKGHEDLLTAWDAFSLRHPNANLLIVGGGFQSRGEEYREAMIASLPRGLGEMKVSWLDTILDVRGAYAAADLSVSPSLSENHGAALEASAMGCPSVVSDAGGLPETVREGDSGWIFPAAHITALDRALEQAYQSWERGELAMMGRVARDVAVSNFDSADAAREVANIVLGRAQ